MELHQTSGILLLLKGIQWLTLLNVELDIFCGIDSTTMDESIQKLIIKFDGDNMPFRGKGNIRIEGNIFVRIGWIGCGEYSVRKKGKKRLRMKQEGKSFGLYIYGL